MLNVSYSVLVKFMLYKTRRLNCGNEEYAAVLDHLEDYLRDLAAHGEAIKPYYKKYAKTKAVERARDGMLMNLRTENLAYRRLKKKMCREFAAKHKNS